MDTMNDDMNRQGIYDSEAAEWKTIESQAKPQLHIRGITRRKSW